MTSLAVLAEDVEGPVVRHRVRAVLPALRDAGVGDVRFVAVPEGLRARHAAFREAGAAGAVLLVRRLFTRFDFAALRQHAGRLAYDFDDALCYRDVFRGDPDSPMRLRRFTRTVRAASLVTAGNAYLAQIAAEVGATAPVVVAPTPIDTDRYAPAVPDATASPGFRVGWIGSRSTRPYLRVVAPALRKLALRRPGLVVAVMADEPPEELAGLKVEFTPWSEEAEVPFLRSLHAGVMPLTDDPWSRGKCGFKLLQYLACGVPAVASPVGVNVEIAEEGRVAKLASSEMEWVSALTALAGDPAAARELGARGRAAVEEKWSARALGPAFAKAIALWARAEASR